MALFTHTEPAQQIPVMKSLLCSSFVTIFRVYYGDVIIYFLKLKFMSRALYIHVLHSAYICDLDVMVSCSIWRCLRIHTHCTQQIPVMKSLALLLFLGYIMVMS